MQNLIVLSSPLDIRSYLTTQWLTSEFKQAAQSPQSFIYPFLQKFYQHPRFFADMTNEAIERAHFTPWFNLILNRHYENPYIHDLYLIHEIIHLVTLTYKLESFELWRQKMFDNEMITSLITEVEIYKHLPIRLKSFAHPIWFDEISYQNFDELKSLRQAAMLHPQSSCEEQIAQYAKNNEQWAQIWKKKFSLVEIHMEEFYKLTNPQQKIESHRAWLNQHSQNQIIFPEEATKFSKIYWAK